MAQNKFLFMNTSRLFLWPTPQPLKLKYFLGNSISHGDIEAIIKNRWPESFPVLFSSARAALLSVLQMQKLSRPDLIWCPPFSSHCVLNAISATATPTTLEIDSPKVALIYHQWGIAHQFEFVDTIIIEDAVDTFFIPGCKLFSTSSNFVLWSLPKVIGCAHGGVVFCRSKSDADALRLIRDARGVSYLQSVLRHLAKTNTSASKYWNGAEAYQGGLPSALLRQIMDRLLAIDELIEQRLIVLHGLSNKFVEHCEKNGRIPSNFPLTFHGDVPEPWQENGRVLSGVRNFNMGLSYPVCKWKQVLPLPIHIDVDERALAYLCKTISSGEAYDELDII